jgi:hypothetical protein
MKKRLVMLLMPIVIAVMASASHAAFNLEVPAEPWDEYRMQFQHYSKHLSASYDRAFVDDYEGAIREVDKAIELLPEEGIGYSERGKYYRLLNNSRLAEADLSKAITLFDQAIERYRPGSSKPKRGARRFNPADAGRLVATLRYQRGEAQFNFEHYRQASDDYAAACQGGHTAACARIWDIKAIEKRGVHWVPLAARQFYDRKRVENVPPATVRVWVRREDPQPVQPESGIENYIQQHLELNCSTREFRLVEAVVISNGRQSMTEKVPSAGFAKPVPGSAPGKLVNMFCSASRPK